MREFGKVHLIANPAAQIGHGADAAADAARMLRAVLGQDAVACSLTNGPGHAADLAEASAAQGFGAVVALGGDGIVNEAVGGLMRLPRAQRPVFGLIPVGSGNDYARTLGMRFDLNMETMVLQVLGAEARPFDVGCVNGRFFAETLSFGLDAAIALDTVERRRRTGRTGTVLYLESGLDQLLFHLHPYRAEIAFESACADRADARSGGAGKGADKRGRGSAAVEGPVSGFALQPVVADSPASDDGGEALARDLFLMAVQIGPTYGGGFRICPEARPDDGLFDICMVDAAIGKPKGIVTFLRAKNGGHTRARHVEFRRVRSLSVRVPAGLAIQADGEHVPPADVYRIECVPGALDALVAQG